MICSPAGDIDYHTSLDFQKSSNLHGLRTGATALPAETGGGNIEVAVTSLLPRKAKLTCAAVD